MSNMIEALESRELFSMSPSAAIAALHVDVNSIGQEIKVLTSANARTLRLMHGEVAIFGSAGGADAANLQAVSEAFITERSALVTNFAYAKVLYGQDVNRLTAAVRTANRKPTNPVLAARVTVAENLLTSQGFRSMDVLQANCDALSAVYTSAVAAVAAAHPIDATLASTAADVASAFSQNVGAIENATSNIANVDIADLITAMDPQGNYTNA